MSEPFLGEIRMFGGNFAPRGWALCNGQIMAISQNAALFSLLGTFYGGNGTSTFGLPNFQGRVPMHWGQSPGGSSYVIGESAGSENVTILYNQMPIHNHLVNATTTPPSGRAAPPTNNVPAVPAVNPTTTTVQIYGPTANTQMSPTMIATAGGNVPTPIMQPFLVVTFIIALQGIFPSRN